MDDYGDSTDVETGGNDIEDGNNEAGSMENVVETTEVNNVSETNDVQAQWNVSEYSNTVQKDIVTENVNSMENLGFMTGRVSESISTYSKEVYDSKYNTTGENILGHHDMKDGSIHVINEYEPAAKHTVTHEIFHKSSYQHESLEEIENGYIASRKSGLLEINNSFDKEGNYISSNEEGRALNEGITEMKTLDYLNSKGEIESAEMFNAYSDSVNVSRQLNDIVGKDVVDSAYFGGSKEELVNEVNRLAKDENAWSKLNADLETATYSKNIDERNAALSRIDNMMNTMMETKELENENS